MTTVGTLMNLYLKGKSVRGFHLKKKEHKW